MNNAVYQKIRTSVNLKREPYSLAIFLTQNTVLTACVFAVWTISGNSISRFFAIPLLTILIFRHFAFMHEAVHNAVSHHKWINDACGVFSGAVCLLPFEPWKRSHLEHHLWAGNIDKDPVTAIITAFPAMHKLTQSTLSFFWRAWFPMLACLQYGVFWWLASKIFLKKRKSWSVLISLTAPIALWGLTSLLVPAGFLFTALLPSLLLYMIAVEVVNFPHHLQLPQNRGTTRLHPSDQYQIARTCLYPKWFAGFVVLNFNYHIEHHMYPDVPWYHLEKLHHKVKAELGPHYNSDLYFNWILENKPQPMGEVLKARNNGSKMSDAA